MSGHWHKVVAGACKPKHAPPKAKYVDALVSSTYSSDGSLQDVTRSLSQRLRDPSPTVVFKCLLVIHTLIRAGNAEEVMPYWSGSDGRDGSRALGLLGFVNLAQNGGNISDVSSNVLRYAHYLGSRLKAYAVLKHDPIRTRAEAPTSLGGAGERRSATAGANRLRTLTVEKGLLREVSTLQKLLDSLVEAKFYQDETSDDLVMTALRLLVKDLLVLFQAVNEGVINVLEHYFEMSKVDATQALKTYKIFCRQCEKVVSYLGVAKKLSSIINVNIPNLRHAPVSLAGSLQEYLDDPNFEKNREEYKESKAIADGRAPAPKPTAVETKAQASSTAPATASDSTAAPPPSTEGNKAFQDFFASIESEQQDMFNPQTGTSSFQQNQAWNPYLQQQQQPQMMYSQPTGFGGGGTMGQSLFGVAQQPQPQLQLQPQVTGFAFGGQMSPQLTGANPFRQSTMFGMSPQQTGFPAGGPFGQQPQPMQPQATGYNPFLQQQQQPAQQTGFPTSFANGSFPGLNRANGASSAPPMQSQPPPTSSPFPAFPSSVSAASPPAPLAVQPTGSRNPFAPPPGSAPHMPTSKPSTRPTLNNLAMSAWERQMKEQQTREEASRLQAEQAALKRMQNGDDALETLANGSAAGGKGKQPQANGFSDFFSSQLSRLEGGGKATVQAQKTGAGGLFSDVASEFATTRPKSAGENPFPSSSGPASFLGGSSATGGGSGLTSSPTSTTLPYNSPFGPSAPSAISPQPTGFGGSSVKPFKPTSSFGTSLASSLPPVAEGMETVAPAPGQSGGMAPQQTGVNPFRMSTMPTGLSSSNSLSTQPTGFSGFSSLSSSMTGSTAPAFSGIKPFQPPSSFGQSSFAGGMPNGSSAPASSAPQVSLI